VNPKKTSQISITKIKITRQHLLKLTHTLNSFFYRGLPDCIHNELNSKEDNTGQRTPVSPLTLALGSGKITRVSIMDTSRHSNRRIKQDEIENLGKLKKISSEE